MMHSADYINELIFDYVETYSFRRGKEYEEYEKLHGHPESTQSLIYAYGRLHPSSKKRIHLNTAALWQNV